MRPIAPAPFSQGVELCPPAGRRVVTRNRTKQAIAGPAQIGPPLAFLFGEGNSM